MKRLYFFCAEYVRRRQRPVQVVGASQSTHVLGVVIADIGDDLEDLVSGLREHGLKDTQERPDEWVYVSTTYREVERGELKMIYQAVTGDDGADENESRRKPKEVFPDSFSPTGEPLFDGQPAKMTTPVRPRRKEEDDPGAA